MHKIILASKNKIALVLKVREALARSECLDLGSDVWGLGSEDLGLEGTGPR